MIKVSTHVIPRKNDGDEKNILKMIPSFYLNENTMIFLSNECYKNIINSSYQTSEDFNFPAAKNFIQFSEAGATSVSFVQLYSSDWVFLEYLCCKEANLFHKNSGTIPTDILFVTYDKEFEQKQVSAYTLMTDANYSPIDCIMTNIPEFKNALFFLTDEAYAKLKANTSTISTYRGMERLVWEEDDFYPGCCVMLHTLGNNYFHFVENVLFPPFHKDFTTKGFPNSVYFVIL